MSRSPISLSSLKAASVAAVPVLAAVALGLGGSAAGAQTGSNYNTTATAAPRSTTTTAAPPQTIIVRVPAPAAATTTTTTAPPPDTSNQDSDGDGIPDLLEGTGDRDGDGIPDYLDAHDYWITGTVFVDENEDSLAGPDDTDPGPINLELHSAGADGAIDTADDQLIARSSSSNYRFSNLNDGVYRIKVAAPQGYNAAGSPIVQISGDPQTVMVPLHREAAPVTAPVLAFDDGSANTSSNQTLALIAFAAAVLGLFGAQLVRRRDRDLRVIQLVEHADRSESA